MPDNFIENYLDNLHPDNNYFADNILNFSAYDMDSFESSGITNNGSLNITDKKLFAYWVVLVTDMSIFKLPEF